MGSHKNSIHSKIKRKLARIEKGQLIFLWDFRDIGSYLAVRVTFNRLAKYGEIRKISYGIYIKPISDPALGDIYPSTEAIIKAIADKKHSNIKPSGPYALYKLGLIKQAPANFLYVTDGAVTNRTIGKTFVKFKKVLPERFATESKISNLIIETVRELGKENIDVNLKQKFKELLLKENKKKFIDEIKIKRVPIHLRNFLYSLLKEP